MANLILDLKSKLLTSQRNCFQLRKNPATDKMTWFAAKLISEKVSPENYHLYLDVQEGFFDFDMIKSIIEELKDRENYVSAETETEAESEIDDVSIITFEVVGYTKNNTEVLINNKGEDVTGTDFCHANYDSAMRGYEIASQDDIFSKVSVVKTIRQIKVCVDDAGDLIIPTSISDLSEKYEDLRYCLANEIEEVFSKTFLLHR